MCCSSELRLLLSLPRYNGILTRFDHSAEPFRARFLAPDCITRSAFIARCLHAELLRERDEGLRHRHLVNAGCIERTDHLRNRRSGVVEPSSTAVRVLAVRTEVLRVGDGVNELGDVAVLGLQPDERISGP